MTRRLLLISNSTNAGEEYLGWPRQLISDFMKDTGVKRLLFLPWAGVNLADGLEASWDVYEQRVNGVFNLLGLEVYSIHKEKDPIKAVENAEAMAVGGGNTFHLVYMMHKTGILDAVKKRIGEGMHFMGWSAGANVACPTMCTTNDMPIIEPASFTCLNLVPFQINPHYLDAHAQGHGGETREQRINEFLDINREITVVGLREATALWVENNHIALKGSRPLRLFGHGKEPVEYQPGEDINFLL
ncbi:MAG: dipeptidase PepE [Bacteroidales bacterium]|nr:dipeptidase PepE [Bacteroidales bacterium]MDZ4204526.1 dipeptidase PepE [Bacteroidales bacterium]